jgi:hypothetical protein
MLKTLLSSGTKLFNAMRGFFNAGYLERNPALCAILDVQWRVRFLHHNSTFHRTRIANEFVKKINCRWL